MKRRFLIVLFAVMMFSCLVLCLTACGHKHNLSHHKAVSANCAKAGNVEYWSCECGKYFSDSQGENEIAKDSYIVPATGHDYQGAEWVVETNATCETNGSRYQLCKNGCGSKNAEIISATGHDYGDIVYVWSADNSSCTASRVCATDGSHVDSATAVITSAVTQTATATLPEITTFTATFSKDGFGTQTITVQTAPCLDPGQTDPGEWEE